MFGNHFKYWSRAGSVLVMTAFASIFLLGMTAMVTDVGYMYYNQARLQTAVNAGWKAGFDLMMQLKDDGVLDSGEQAQVTEHVKEVMKVNGYTDAELANLQVIFGPNNELEVRSNHNIGLFFANVMNFSSATVAANRDNSGDILSGQGIVPLAIPYGVTKDLTKNTYVCEMFPRNPDGSYDPTIQGFATGTTYILKLGSGGPNSGDPGDPMPEVGKILVPMDAGSQDSDGFLKAYGAAFWCLKIDESDPGFVPVEWLLGYRGGAFLLPNHDDVKSILRDYDVNYVEITDGEELQAIYDAVNPNVLELFDRPRVAVYSSQGSTDPVEQVLRDGKIPYGTYSQPGNWARNQNYRESNCNAFYDLEILNNELDNYEWLHLHHEDFTGFSGGCSYYTYSCKDFLDNGWLGSTSRTSRRETCKTRMCAYCRQYYNPNYPPDDYRDFRLINGYNEANCHNINRRCADKRTYQGTYWKDIDDIYICLEGNEGYPQCSHDNTLRQMASSKGYTSDAGSEPKPQWSVSSNGTTPVGDNASGWFDKANKVQKMKWDVVRKVKLHLEQGGFVFAQCFAPETFDLALWQAAIYEGKSPSQAYDDCVAFKEFHYTGFPRRLSPVWYSDINTRDSTYNQYFNLLDPLDPRCQNHGSGYCCDTGSGHTAGFLASQIKSEITVLGYQSGTGNNYIKYLKGKFGNGDFTFLGGHYHRNVEAKRLVLNNIMLGSLVEKNVGGGGTTTITGKQKSNYGPVDPDNYTGGGANDYRDRFMHGFNQPLQLSDRILPEPGNQRGPTDQAVDFRVNGDANNPPSKYIIVPITDVPPEVGTNNTHNATAQTVYDLQGQDHPNGIYDPTKYGFGSSVRIIGFAKFEIIPTGDLTEDNPDARVGETYSSGDAGDLGPYQPGQVRGKFVEYVIQPGEVPLY